LKGRATIGRMTRIKLSNGDIVTVRLTLAEVMEVCAKRGFVQLAGHDDEPVVLNTGYIVMAKETEGMGAYFT
jgi:hypothetical protein